MAIAISDKYAQVEIVERRDYSPDLWSIRVSHELPFEFRAGQYATLGVEVDGKPLERPYSIVSAPEEGELEFFIELIPDGALTPHLHPLQVGASLLMRKRPKGVFLKSGLDPDLAHLFLATVTGIAPFASILRQLQGQLRQGEIVPPKIVLVQGASFSHEFGYGEEMDQIALEFPDFEYVPTVSRPWGESGWEGEVGRAEDILRKHADRTGIRPGRGRVYLCGHPGMISSGRAVMLRAGLPDQDILEEQYWPEGKAPASASE
ncbi:MAG TPA: FAD-binding oxidoreductase [Candidatus Dormibacteraeota bacterium]|nr:FAD-binding oxidoreductase [Candidatus Dormibacteraeota bacterium]